jgi:hypothetical protein
MTNAVYKNEKKIARHLSEWVDLPILEVGELFVL